MAAFVPGADAAASAGRHTNTSTSAGDAELVTTAAVGLLIALSLTMVLAIAAVVVHCCRSAPRKRRSTSLATSEDSEWVDGDVEDDACHLGVPPSRPSSA